MKFKQVTCYVCGRVYVATAHEAKRNGWTKVELPSQTIWYCREHSPNNGNK